MDAIIDPPGATIPGNPDPTGGFIPSTSDPNNPGLPPIPEITGGDDDIKKPAIDDLTDHNSFASGGGGIPDNTAKRYSDHEGDDDGSSSSEGIYFETIKSETSGSNYTTIPGSWDYVSEEDPGRSLPGFALPSATSIMSDSTFDNEVYLHGPASMGWVVDQPEQEVGYIGTYRGPDGTFDVYRAENGEISDVPSSRSPTMSLDDRIDLEMGPAAGVSETSLIYDSEYDADPFFQGPNLDFGFGTVVWGVGDDPFNPTDGHNNSGDEYPDTSDLDLDDMTLYSGGDDDSESIDYGDFADLFSTDE